MKHSLRVGRGTLVFYLRLVHVFTHNKRAGIMGHMPVIPALGKLSEAGRSNPEASIGYIVSQYRELLRDFIVSDLQK